jgi:glycosyltransferase involved in cell wall biosynthesis
MHILYLSISHFGNIELHGIYSNLVKYLIDQGHCITLVFPSEPDDKEKVFSEKGPLKYVPVSTGKLVKCKSRVCKGISTLLLEREFLIAIKRYCSDTHFDLVLYATPPITFCSVVRYIKKRDGAKSYLMLKDIFPQNALDIGLLPSKGPWALLVRWFRCKEQSLYNLSDYIGCMSEKNVTYLLEHNPDLVSKKNIEVCPNSLQPIPRRILFHTESLRKQTTFIYGGNLGKPQGIDFLVACLKANNNKPDRKFIICGTGTEAHLVESFIEAYPSENCVYIPGLGVEDYEKLVLDSDVGLVFLDHRFTIPNFPSRILSYMEKSMPVLACTDPNTDMRELIDKEHMGWWCESNDVDVFTSLVDSICSMDTHTLKRLGENARDCLERNYIVSVTYEKIMSHFIGKVVNV